MFVDLQMMTWYKLVAGNSGKKYFMFDGVIFVKKSIGNYFKVIVSWKEPIEITFQQKKNHETCLSNRLINFLFFSISLLVTMIFVMKIVLGYEVQKCALRSQ